MTNVQTTRYKLVDGKFIKSLPPLRWCVKDVLPAQGLAVIYGASGSGKSFLALDLACAIAEGRRWFGYRVEQRPVVYLCLEGQAGFRLRIAAWEQANARSLPEQLQFLFDDFNLPNPDDVQELAATAPANSVFIIDTLNRAAPLIDENSSKEMGIILNSFKQLQRLTNGLVIPVHHTGKNIKAGMRGHSSLNSAADASIDVSKTAGVRRWTTAKVKDGSDGLVHSFKLKTYCVATGIYEDQTSCVIFEDTSKSEIKAVKVIGGKNQKTAMNVITTLLSHASENEGGQRIRIEDAILAVANKLTCASDRQNTIARDTINGLAQNGSLNWDDGWISNART